MCIVRIQVVVIIILVGIIIEKNEIAELFQQAAEEREPPGFEHDPVHRLPRGLAQGAAL